MSTRGQLDGLSVRIFLRLLGMLVISVVVFQSSTATADTKLPQIIDPSAKEPTAVAINPQTNKIYVANRNSNNITVIDGETNTFINITDPNATAPIAVAVNSATNQIYVSNTTSKNITVIDGDTNTTTTVTDAAVSGSGLAANVPAPDSIAVNHLTDKIYVANTTDNSVTVVDGETTTTTNIPVGNSPIALVVNTKTNKVYVANFGSNFVSVIDGSTNQVVETINVGEGAQGLALNHVTNKIYVGNVNDNSISVIDADTDTVKSTVNLAAYYSSLTVYPTALAVNYVTNKVYVGNDGNNTVTVINGQTDQISKSLSISTGFPVMLDVNAELNKIYVTGTIQNVVTLIDGQNDTFSPIPDIGTGPVALAVNPTTHRVYVANKQGNTVGVIDGAPPPDNQGPILTITPEHLSFEAVENAGNPPAQNFNIGKTGQGTLQWTVGVNNDAQNWLSVNKTSGSNTATVAVSVDSSGLEIGKHIGYVTIKNQTTPDSERVVTVVLNVLAPPKLFVSQNEFTFWSIAGTPIKMTTNPVSIYNLNGPGGADLNWNANVSSNAASWLSVDKNSGTVGDEPDEIRLTVDSANLQPGDQQGKVTINSNGGTETIEMNGSVEPAPDFCNGNMIELNKSKHVRLAIEKVNITQTADGGCDVKGELHVRAPHNDLRVSNISGHVNGSNRFAAQLGEPLEFRRGSVYVKLEAPQIYLAQLGQYILVSDQFTWKLSALGTNVEQTYSTKAAITGWGMIFEDTSFDFPDLKLDSFEVTNVKAEPRWWNDGADPGLKITGQIRIKIPQNDVKADTTLYVRSDNWIYGEVTNFSFKNFAGLSVTAEKIVFGTPAETDGYVVYIKRAELTLPGEWVDAESGNISSFVSMVIYRDDAYILEGGFSLPSIKAGDFRLFSLSGSLIRKPGGYEIRASGGLGFPGGKTSGDCFIYVEVVLFNSTDGKSVLQFESPTDPNISKTISADELSTSPTTQTDLTASSLKLREITVDVAICPPYIAIGTTGFFITRVSGTVTLSSGIDRIRVKLWIESGDKKGNVALISAESQVTLQPRPFRLDMNSVIKTLGIQTNQASILIDQRNFGTTFEYDYTILHADLTVNAGILTSGKFYVSGSGSATVGVQRASIHDGGCKKVFNPFTFEEENWCLHIPPYDVNLPAEGRTEFGLFKNDAYGVKGFVEFGQYQSGFFFNANNGSLKLGDVREYQLVQPNVVQAALQSWQAVQNGTFLANQANIDERFTFPSENEILIDAPITPAAPIQALDATQPVDITLQSDIIFLVSKFPESTLQFRLITPSGTEISAASLPANVGYEEASDGTIVQMIYTVKEAEIGNWQAKIIGNTNTEPFQLAVLGNEPAHVLDNLTLTPTGNPNRFNVGWALRSVKPNTRINIYASEGPIEATLAGSTGPLFTGVPLELDLASNLTGTPQQQTIDLGRLPSGNYWIWVEADDGETPPIRKYINQGNEATKININHMASFESRWTTDITATPDVNAAQMQIGWDVSPVHPDVDSYTLRLRSPDPFTPDTELLREIELGNIAEGTIASTVVGGIEPGRAYYVSIGAEDIETQRISWSQEALIMTASPDFSITTPISTLEIKAGEQIQVPIEITKANIPGSVILSVVNDSLPDGLTLTFGNDPITATTAGNITADIIARASVIEGSYLVPIIGEGASIERFLDLTVNVKATGNSNGNGHSIYLPVVIK